KDDIVADYVKADNLKDVNAFSFALPYSPQDFEFVGIDNHLAKHMYNMTNDRLHSNHQKALYPTFVNLREKDVINSKDVLVITIKFKAKRAGKFNLTAKDMMLVSKGMKSLQIK